MAKTDKKELVKHAKALNKLDLTDEPVEVKGDVDTIQEDFIQGIEEIDDAGQIDEVDDDVLDFYEGLIEEPKKKKGKGKKGKKDKKSGKKGKGKKGKKSKKDKDPDPDDAPDIPDLEDLEEELDDMDFDELETYAEENDIDFDYEEDEDEEEDIVKGILKHWKALAKKAKKAKKGKKGKKDKKGKGKKGKKDKKGKKGKKKSDLPKGIRTGTLPAAVYEAIKDDGATWTELAEVVAEEKDKEVDSCFGLAMRTVSRKVSKAVPIRAIFNGEDASAVFELVTDDDDDD